MINSLLFSLLFLLPFVVLPFGISYFETPKVFLAEIGIELLLLLFLFRHSERSEESNRVGIRFFGFKPQNDKSIVHFALAGIVLLSIVHLIFLRTSTTFFGNAFRLQGILLLWHLIAFAALSSKMTIEHIKSKVFFLLLLSHFLFTLVFGVNQAGRAVGSIGEPNALASYILFLWPFLWFAPNQLRIWKISSRTLGLGLVLIIILLTGSRSALFGFVMQGIFLRFRSITIPIAILLVSLILPIIEGGGWYENRAEIWQSAVQAGWNHPILGAGFGNIESSLKQASIELYNNVHFQFIDSSHNIFFDWWVQGGIMGLILFSTLLFTTVRTFIIQKRIRELVIFLGIFETMLFNPVSIVNLLAFWWIVGQSISRR